jgi:hypothetical protein
MLLLDRLAVGVKLDRNLLARHGPHLATALLL